MIVKSLFVDFDHGRKTFQNVGLKENTQFYRSKNNWACTCE